MPMPAQRSWRTHARPPSHPTALNENSRFPAKAAPVCDEDNACRGHRAYPAVGSALSNEWEAHHAQGFFAHVRGRVHHLVHQLRLEKINTAARGYGLTPTQASQYGGGHVAFLIAYNNANPPDTRSPTNIMAKTAAIKTLKNHARQ